MKNNGLVILSGGQDSTTTALFARLECKELHGVTFNYGQKHKIEINSAIKIAKLLNFKSHEVINIKNTLKSTSPIINKKKKITKYNSKTEMTKGMKASCTTSSCALNEMRKSTGKQHKKNG